MDFDLDDPLGSDDSFFEEPKTTLLKRSSISKTPEKKSLESIFGLTEKSTNENITKTSEKKSLDSILGLPEKTESKSKPSVTFEGDASNIDTKKPNDDWLVATKSPSNISEKNSKKSDFLDDILSIKPKSSKPERKVSSLEDILKESKVPTVSKLSSSLKDVNTPADTPDFGSMSTNVNRRRGRRGSFTGVEDNLGLGLFTDEYQSGDFYSKNKKGNEVTYEEIQSKRKNESDTHGIPDWLGGSVKPETVSKKEESSKTSLERGINKEEVKMSSIDSDKLIEKIPPKNIESSSSMAVDEFSLRPQQINMDIQNSYAALHQQESLLLVSLQFKKYEDSLVEIKRQQQEILGKQEKQFHTLVNEYIMKQQMVENNIRLQQERINNQIQMLISSSPMVHMKENSPDTIENELAYSELSGIVHKLKERHDEEMSMMEESFKKQLDMAEKSNSALEEKLRNELENISQILDDKIISMRTKHEEELSYHAEKNKVIDEQHKDEIKLLKEKHAVQLEEIKQEHTIQIDYIKELKRKESELLGDGHLFTQKIDSGIELLSRSTRVLQEMEEKVVQNYDVLAMARENSIESKEKEILLMRNALQKSREAAENERAQLLGLVRNLEIKIAEQSANGQEDRWALQQATATLTARATAIEREAEYNKTVLEREREQLKTLKESLLADQEKMVLRLTEEKLQLSSDKARFETSSKITNTFEIDKMKAEAESAITVAKELTEKVNQERIHMYRQKSELETLRRNLVEREKELDDRETELDDLVQDTRRKLKEDKKVLTEAKRMERVYKERMQELQSQWLSLNDREKKLSEEKVLLSRERLALYTSMKTAKSCALCKPDDGLSFEALQQMTVQNNLENFKTLDANTMRLRLGAMEDDESEVSKEESRSVRINEPFT